MTHEAIMLRDESGREYRVAIADNGSIVVDGVELCVGVASDGSMEIAGARRTRAWAIASGHVCWVFLDGRVFMFEVEHATRRRRQTAGHHAALAAPMPAMVRHVAVAPGDTVRRGDVLIVLEAMKMELPVRAFGDGRVGAVHCREGEMVQGGQELVEME